MVLFSRNVISEAQHLSGLGNLYTCKTCDIQIDLMNILCLRFHFNSDAFGPKIKSENIPGTPMEQVDAMMLSDSTETNSTSNSSFINEVSDHLSQAQASHQPRRTSLDLTTTDANHINSKSTNNNANKDWYWRRPSITPSEDDSNKRRPSKQDKEVCAI